MAGDKNSEALASGAASEAAASTGFSPVSAPAVPKTMRAVVIDGVTEGKDARLSEVAVPAPRPGWVLVRVRAFGLNHSEQMVRLDEIQRDWIAKPCVPGIECVGEVADPGDSRFAPGEKVCALMGGMGRSFWGGYAEYALVPASHVFSLPEELTARLSWEELAAIPETYHTAWGSLFEALELTADDTLLVRGATSALGYAAVQLARAAGARVVATTHRESRLAEVEALLGPRDRAVLDTGALAGTPEVAGVTKALEVVGPKTLQDTMRCLPPRGTVCNMGVLGGQAWLRWFDPIKDIPSCVRLTSFYSNRPTQAGMADLFSFMARHELTPQVGAQFDFDHVADALAAQDAGGQKGKIVVRVA